MSVTKSAVPLTPAEEVLEKFKETRMKGLADRETQAQEQRQRLRDSAVQLREPSSSPATAPASTSQPTFKIGDAAGFPYVTERAPTTPGNGHLSPKAAETFYAHMEDAARRPDAASRDASTSRAAKVVASDWAAQHGLTGQHVKDNIAATALHEFRAQATFATRELGKKLGVGPVESTLIGHSLERALEREGFKVFVNHAIDKSGDFFKSTASSVATSSGLRHAAEENLSKSMNWLASHGVTRDGLKQALGKHAGKLQIVMELSHHPEVVQKAALVLSKSDSLASGVMLLAKDDEFRKSVGTLTMAAGESVAIVHKGIGSVAILGGSVLRGDTNEETARHAFRAALTIAGGAAGAVAGLGVASIAVGTGGALLGSVVADKLLDLYDKHLGQGPHTAARSVTRDDLQDSSKVLADRIGSRMKEEAGSALASKLPAVAERGREMEREYSMKHPSSGKA
jgi:hypothetical protein